MNITIIELENINFKRNTAITKSKFKFNKTHKLEDLAMIFFTSGSTGDQKEYLLNKNFLSCFFQQYKKFYNNKSKLTFADFHDSSFVISIVIILPSIYTQSSICPAKHL